MIRVFKDELMSEEVTQVSNFLKDLNVGIFSGTASDITTFYVKAEDGISVVKATIITELEGEEILSPIIRVRVGGGESATLKKDGDNWRSDVELKAGDFLYNYSNVNSHIIKSANQISSGLYNIVFDETNHPAPSQDDTILYKMIDIPISQSPTKIEIYRLAKLNHAGKNYSATLFMGYE